MAMSLQFNSLIGPQKMLYNSHTDPSVNLHFNPSQSTWSLRPILDPYHPDFCAFPLLIPGGIDSQISLRRRQTLWLQLPTPQYRRHNGVLIWTCPSRPILAGASLYGSWRMEHSRSYLSLGVFSVRVDSCSGRYSSFFAERDLIFFSLGLMCHSRPYPPMGPGSHSFRPLWLVPRSQHLPHPRFRKPIPIIYLLTILIIPSIFFIGWSKSHPAPDYSPSCDPPRDCHLLQSPLFQLLRCW